MQFEIFSEFDKELEYLGILDPASGKLQDYSVLSIFSISESGAELCALFRDNSISPVKLCSVIIKCLSYFENPALLIENNKFSEIGYILEDTYDYPDILRTCKVRNKTVIGSSRNSDIGLNMSTKVKLIGCEQLKLLVEAEKIIINSKDAITEFKTFSENSRGSYSAEDNKTDDICMTFVILAWALIQDYFDCDFSSMVALDSGEKVTSESDDSVELFIGIFDDTEINF